MSNSRNNPLNKELETRIDNHKLPGRFSGMFFKLFFGIWFTALLTSIFVGVWGYFFHFKPDRARFAEMGQNFLQAHGKSLVDLYESNGGDAVERFEPPGLLIIFDSEKKLILKFDKHPNPPGMRRGGWGGRPPEDEGGFSFHGKQNNRKEVGRSPGPERFSEINWETPEIYSFLSSLDNENEGSFLEIRGRIVIGAKILSNSGKGYYILKGLPRELSMKHERFFKAIFTITPIFLFTTTILCFFLTRSFVRPVNDLRRVSREFSNGNLKARPGQKELERKDEIGDLTRDFNHMSEKIESMMVSQKRLLSDISHELRSPLARLKVALELLIEKSTEDSKKLISRIDTETDRLNSMIGQVLELSRADLTQNYDQKKDLNLYEILEKVVVDARFEAASKKCEIVLETNEKSLEIGCFEDQLNRAIENVIRNAIKYSPENSKISVSMAAEKNNVQIIISDSGPGVAEEELGRLFEPFYRVNTARDRKTGGAGLGLAISRKAVESHKGKISAKNGKNGGLEVYIELPLL